MTYDPTYRDRTRTFDACWREAERADPIEVSAVALRRCVELERSTADVPTWAQLEAETWAPFEADVADAATWDRLAPLYGIEAEPIEAEAEGIEAEADAA